MQFSWWDQIINSIMGFAMNNKLFVAGVLMVVLLLLAILQAYLTRTH